MIVFYVIVIVTIVMVTSFIAFYLWSHQLPESSIAEDKEIEVKGRVRKKKKNNNKYKNNN